MSSQPDQQYDLADFDFSDEGVRRYLAYYAPDYDPDDFDFSDDARRLFLI